MSSPSLLRTYSTMKIGGECERLVFIKDLKAGVPLVRPIRILGNGSNVLIDDQKLKGTVILTRDFSPAAPEVVEDGESGVVIRCGAGTYLPGLASWASKNALSGCEYMVGIPGTLGGAVVQNAGAHDQDLKSILVKIEVFDLNESQTRILTADECKLDYRTSALKSWPHLLVSRVWLKLKKASAELIRRQSDLNLEYRKTKTPYSKPSLGSIYTRIKTENSWLYPGKLIEDAGLKGYRVGGAMVSTIHANYIVNEDQASFEDVINLMKTIERKVFEQSGIHLVREILIWSDRAEFSSESSG